jgi:uncharacterized protein
MTFTEIKERNGNNYYYRVLSLRNGKKVSKKRKYLGVNILKQNLTLKEQQADKELKLFSSKNKTKLADKLISQIVKILKKYDIKKAGIFGSYARGEQTAKSDIDILVEPPKNIGFGFAGIQIELQDKLGRKVDLVSYNGLSPYLKDRILNDEVRII